MCGITGILAFNLVGKFHRMHIAAATQALRRRGPDHQGLYTDDWVALGHRRLSVIDTSEVAHQPMWDESKRYAIVFNGEIFNFQSLRQDLERQGVSFFSQSDTEVLLKLYIREGSACLNKLNGFFAFCIYDRSDQSCFLARDRFGVKPLLYLIDDDKFLFASEMKAMIEYGISRAMSPAALHSYFQLNYIPAPLTVFEQVRKLMPGHCMTVRHGSVSQERYYEIPYDSTRLVTTGYQEASHQLEALLETAVQRRLVADVPVGSFLSGGIDSSVISALASRHHPDLQTFSIGYKDEPFFDETNYARLVASKLGTRHTVFSLSNADLYRHVGDILDYIDEPFADSSAIAVYILSKETRKHATVALSGDGADELVSGYHKHSAWLRSIRPGWKEKAVESAWPLLSRLPQSRHSFLGNKIRQLSRFGAGMRMHPRDRYQAWASYANEAQVNDLLLAPWNGHQEENPVDSYLNNLGNGDDFNRFLLTDMKLVLPNDMLVKVDWMSMANALEVRTPFLDVDVVNFLFTLPVSFKIDAGIRKKIVQDTFRSLLPQELYNRPKKGFEVPLLKWLRTEMKSVILDDLLSADFVKEQGIFNAGAIEALKRQLFSANPGDIHARIWAIVVFQHWWKKYGRA